MNHKDVQKLTERSHRTLTGLFVVEGEKNICELLQSSLEVRALFGTKLFLAAHEEDVAQYEKKNGTQIPVYEVPEEKLVKMGTFTSNNAGLAVAVQKPEVSRAQILEKAQKHTVVVLDDIRDPGNLGTIIRTADWYGIDTLVLSPTTTDVYNQKAITSTMGSFTRAHILRTPLQALLKEAPIYNIPVIVADMEGANVRTAKLPTHGFLVMGSESHGISNDVRTYATHTLTIPRIGRAESLNVSVATAIFLDRLSERFT